MSDITRWASIGLLLVACRERVAFIAGESGSGNQIIDQWSVLALDNNGHLYVIEGEEDRVRRVDLSDGTISVVAGYGRKQGKDDCVHRDGIQATQACLQSPASLAVDASGNLFIGEISGYVRKVDVGSGLISTVTGSGNSGETVEGSSALAANFWGIDGLAIDAENNLFILDGHQEAIFKVDSKSGVVIRVAGNGKQGFPRRRRIGIARQLPVCGNDLAGQR